MRLPTFRRKCPSAVLISAVAGHTAAASATIGALTLFASRTAAEM